MLRPINLSTGSEFWLGILSLTNFLGTEWPWFCIPTPLWHMVPWTLIVHFSLVAVATTDYDFVSCWLPSKRLKKLTAFGEGHKIFFSRSQIMLFQPRLSSMAPPIFRVAEVNFQPNSLSVLNVISIQLHQVDKAFIDLCLSGTHLGCLYSQKDEHACSLPELPLSSLIIFLATVAFFSWPIHETSEIFTINGLLWS